MKKFIVLYGLPESELGLFAELGRNDQKAEQGIKEDKQPVEFFCVRFFLAVDEDRHADDRNDADCEHEVNRYHQPVGQSEITHLRYCGGKVYVKGDGGIIGRNGERDALRIFIEAQEKRDEREREYYRQRQHYFEHR